MKPYYSENGITIYHGDCRDVLPSLGRFDLLLTDPPYGINYKPEGGGKVAKRFTNADRVVGDNKDFDPGFMLDLASNQVIWGGSNFADKLPASRCWLVWDKKDGIYYDNQFSDCEIAWTNRDAPIKVFHHRWTGYHKASEKDRDRVHPTQKPLKLMQWCLSFFPDAQTILDPFMGSGTTLLAAKLEGRQATGIEINERYCESAAKRLSQQVFEFEPIGAS